MTGYLRMLAVGLLISGLAVCLMAISLAVGDETFFKAREALARHTDHVLFQGEYYAALIRHIAYILTAVLAGLIGIVGSAVLFGLHGVMRRLERLSPSR